MTNVLDEYKEHFLQFRKYVRRHELARFLLQHELFKKTLDVKGLVVEYGVYQGSGFLAWAKLSEILEPIIFYAKSKVLTHSKVSLQ